MFDRNTQSFKIEYLEQMYLDYGPDIMRFLARKVGPTAASDLFQDTFVQALTHFDKLDSIVSPKAWLIKIAYNLSCNFYRKKKLSFIELSEDHIFIKNNNEDPRLDRIRNIVQTLPTQKKDIILLKWYDQLSYEEISHILEIPIGTVRSRLHNSMNLIRRQLSLSTTEV